MLLSRKSATKSLNTVAILRKRPDGGRGQNEFLSWKTIGRAAYHARSASDSFSAAKSILPRSPEYGFELALKKTYDLLIFDFSMPMIDGAMLFF